MLKKDIYNKLATTYENSFDVLLEEQIKVRTEYFLLLKQYIDNPKIIDIGFGTGRDMKFFEELGANVTGIDISEGMFKIAKKKGLKNLYLGDIRNYKFSNESFHGVWLLSVLQDLNDKKDIRSVLLKSYDLLKYNGLLFLIHPNFIGYPMGKVIVKRERYGFSEQTYNIRIDDLIESTINCGFEILNKSKIKHLRFNERKEYISLICKKTF